MLDPYLSPSMKNKSKQIKDLDVRFEILNLLEVKTGVDRHKSRHGSFG